MDKFLIKRPRNSIDSSSNSCSTPAPTSTTTPTQASIPTPTHSSSHTPINGIVSDPGLRKQINEFDVGVRDRIRREYISQGPCQPKGHSFPKTKYGGSMRSFREDWYKKFDWLEYSISNDAAYCFSCYLFKPINIIRYGDEAFTKDGFKNWKKASENFLEHVREVGSPHHNAKILFEAFKKQRQSLPHLLTSTSREMEVAYHTRLAATLDVTSFLLRQGLSFHGHDDSSTSLNRENFLEWYSTRNQEIAKVVSQNAPGNNQMTSPYIQKQMANACAVETTLAILKDIGDSLFTILVDESRDISVKEQMMIVLRYVNKNGEVIERFLVVVHVEDTSSKCLKDVIDTLFSKHGLSLSRLRGRGYDGASNM